MNEALEKTKEYQRAKNQRGEKPLACSNSTDTLMLTCMCCVAAALMSLKRKKAYEKQIEQIDNSISRVNEQQMMLENQRTTAETVLALQQGVRANKATMQVWESSHLCCKFMPKLHYSDAKQYLPQANFAYSNLLIMCPSATVAFGLSQCICRSGTCDFVMAGAEHRRCGQDNG